MANKHLRNILLYVLLQAVWWHHAVDTSFEVAVEGGRIEIECTTNSSLGVDWKFNNGTNEYGLYTEGVVPDAFKVEYSVTKVNYSSYKISYLSIERVKKSNVGTYICINGEPRQILTSVDLALLTIPICEPDTNSTETMRRYVCNFTSAGNISSRSEWIEDFCTNSTPTTCSDANEGNIYCEFPINRRNRKFLPFATNLTSHGIEVCEIIYTNCEEASTEGFQMTSLKKMSIKISVLLRCWLNPTLTTTNTITTPARSHRPIIGYVAMAGALLILIGLIIATCIFRNRNACSCRENSRNENNEQESSGEQIDVHVYHELEAFHAEIASEPTGNAIADNNFVYDSVATENALVDNLAYDSVPTSHNADTYYDKAIAVVYP